MIPRHCALSDRNATRAIEGVSIAVSPLSLLDFHSMYDEIPMSEFTILWRGYPDSLALGEWLELLFGRQLPLLIDSAIHVPRDTAEGLQHIYKPPAVRCSTPDCPALDHPRGRAYI